MDYRELLRKIKSSLKKVYGERLSGIILYGSEARGEGKKDSDIDILVLLNGPVTSWRDIKIAAKALYPLMLRLDRIIDARPINLFDYEKAEAPLYVQARREGISA